jgi:CRISPR-associated protein Cmr2
MARHLIAISIGPVQDFIAAARRTRDLWMGSHLLSEICKAAAVSVVAPPSSGEPIFPPPKADLKHDSSTNVANVILAILGDGIDPSKVAKTARDAAKKRWEEFATAALDLGDTLIDRTIWNAQIEDAIEFYSAWAEIRDGEDPGARTRAMRLLAGRKACRDFGAAKGWPKIPKSSLDGARETVLICAADRAQTQANRAKILIEKPELAQRLRLTAGEELDAIGFTKRAAKRESFPSLTRVAADPWIRGIERPPAPASNLLREIAKQCEGSHFATRTGNYYKGIFPFDGAVLFPSRLAGMLSSKGKRLIDPGFEPALISDDFGRLESIHTSLNQLQSPRELGFDEPEPYLAVIAADGDRIGKALSGIKSYKVHQNFSSALGEFAAHSEAIVKDNHGCPVYCGGDDVLAFAPLDTCLTLVRKLRDEFVATMKSALDDRSDLPTLSVGIAIGHCMEPMEELLAWARSAEKHSKEGEKNALAVHLHTRGGAPIRLRREWSDSDKALDKRLLQWSDLHVSNRIPDKAAYDLLVLARDYENWPTSNDEKRGKFATALRSDAIRLLSRKGTLGHQSGLDKIRELLEGVLTEKDLIEISNEVIVARRISAAVKQALGKDPAQSAPVKPA